MASTQDDFILLRHRQVRFANHRAVHSDTSGFDPLLGASFRGSWKPQQQGIQQPSCGFAFWGGLAHLRSDFLFRNRDKVERVAMSRLRWSVT